MIKVLAAEDVLGCVCRCVCVRVHETDLVAVFVLRHSRGRCLTQLSSSQWSGDTVFQGTLGQIHNAISFTTDLIRH